MPVSLIVASSAKLVLPNHDNLAFNIPSSSLACSTQLQTLLKWTDNPTSHSLRELQPQAGPSAGCVFPSQNGVGTH